MFRNSMKEITSGFTLVEMLIALTVFGIMLSVGAPLLVTFMEDAQLKSDTNDMFASLFFARSEAVTRNTTVSLCKTNQNSPEDCDNSESWQSGWIAFVDADSDGVRDAGETVLNAYTGMKDNSAVSSTNFSNVISFLPSGYTSTNGTINICVNNNTAQDIFINATGRPRVSVSACP